MVYVLTVIVAVIAFSLVVLLSAQVELFRDMKQVRELTGMIDRPFPLDLGVMRGHSPADLGLPTKTGAILILSDKCATCRSLAAALDGAVPPHLQIVLSNPGGRASECRPSGTWVIGRSTTPTGQSWRRWTSKPRPPQSPSSTGL